MHMRVASDGYSGRPQPRTLFLGPGTKIAHGAVAAKFSVNDTSGTENSPQLQTSSQFSLGYVIVGRSCYPQNNAVLNICYLLRKISIQFTKLPHSCAWGCPKLDNSFLNQIKFSFCTVRMFNRECRGVFSISHSQRILLLRELCRCIEVPEMQIFWFRSMFLSDSGKQIKKLMLYIQNYCCNYLSQ